MVKVQKIIDTHVHHFDLETFKVLWLEEEPLLLNTNRIQDYKKSWIHKDRYSIEGIIHVELDTISSQKEQENKYFINLAHTEPLIKGIVIYADMLNPKADLFMDQYKNEACIKGIRHILHVPTQEKGTCLKSVFVKNVQSLATYGWHFEACMRAEELNDLYVLAKQCPNTVFVLNHMGLPDINAWKDKGRYTYVQEWKSNMKLLASLDNVTCKVSGLASSKVEDIQEVVDWCIECFGYYRCMFASNFPVCNLNINFDEWVCALLRILEKYPQQVQEQFFYKNALRIYAC